MNKNIEIELKHIQLELLNNRTQHLRHFIDQYFCYERGYINRNGKAKWNSIFWHEFVSNKAEKLTDKKLVVKEHVVPLKFITENLKKLNSDCSIQEIKKVLDKYLHFATITKDEDALLRKMGLNHKMPDEFFDINNKLYNDIFARYKIAKIEFKKV